MRKIDIKSLDLKIIIYNLYLTQALALLLSFLLYFFIQHMTPIEVFQTLFPDDLLTSSIIGIAFTLIVVLINIILTKTLPEDLYDDGGVNEKIFESLPIWHIALLSLIVGFSEELLFRGVIQSFLGVIGTSILFTAIHFRYLKKIVLLTVTFITSLGLGLLAYYVDWYAAFIAHFLIDFILGIMIRMRILK